MAPYSFKYTDSMSADSSLDKMQQALFSLRRRPHYAIPRYENESMAPD
jgi:hypothetical protein